jgi:hypothetical protein
MNRTRSPQPTASAAGPSRIRRKAGVTLGTVALASAMTLAFTVPAPSAAPWGTRISVMLDRPASIDGSAVSAAPAPTQPPAGSAGQPPAGSAGQPPSGVIGISETGCCA